MPSSQTINLKAPRDFHLPATVLSHGWHECSPFHWSHAALCFQTVERVGGEVHRLSVMQGKARRGGASLSMYVDGPESKNGIVGELSLRVRIMLGLDRDLSEFYELCKTHPALGPIPSIGGGRITRSPSMTENIVKMLCSTNVNWTQAVKMINRIAQLGPHVPHFRNLTAWPTPREILNAGEKYLDGVCRLGYRCDSILRFCRDVDSGKLDPDRFDAMAADPGVESDDILALMLEIRGVGPATAHGLLGFLGRHDRLAIDSATIAHVARTHTDGAKPTRKQIEAVYAPYGKWKNLVYWCENWLQWDTAREMLDDAR